MVKKLAGQMALVTGGTRGIGAAIAKELYDLGANVIITGTNPDYSSSCNYKYICVDFSNRDSLHGFVNEIHGLQIDILINNAGINQIGSISELKVVDFERVQKVNVTAPFMLCQAVLPRMRERKWGRIVNIGSSSAYNGFGGTSLYCASKHALLGFSRSIHDELKQYNVRTFCISPSSTQSKMGLATKNQDYSTFIEPSDIAKYVVFVISFDGNLVSEEVALKRIIVK